MTMIRPGPVQTQSRSSVRPDSLAHRLFLFSAIRPRLSFILVRSNRLTEGADLVRYRLPG
jgi:hypothetical protein